VNILHAWKVNSVNKLVKNKLKKQHITAIFSFKSNIFPSTSQASCLAFVIQIKLFQHSCDKGQSTCARDILPLSPS